MKCQHILLSGRRRGNRCNLNNYSLKLYCRKHYKKYEQNTEEKVEEKEFIYESCKICNKKNFKPKVLLECKCEYHLSCYLSICIESFNCINCNDIIFKKDSDYEQCSICFENIILRDNKHIITNCNHKFHTKCINKWKIIKNNCPECRGDL